MLGLGIVKTSTANSLQVAREVKDEIARINPTLPEGMQMGITYDSTEFIDVAVDEVYKTLVEAIVLVLIVIWLFLGSVRAALIPAVTVPVCVIAAFIALWAFGFSINLLTLLALVLSHRPGGGRCHRGAGERAAPRRPRRAAAAGGPARHAPGGVRGDRDDRRCWSRCSCRWPSMEGNNGRLFRELAVALAGAVAISAFVALTLTPMMCSLLLQPHDREATGLQRLD